MILNLLNNAREAVEKKYKVMHQVDRTVSVSIIPHPSENEVILTIDDKGLGMEKEVLDRCFEPFFSTKIKGVGSGLGLATVYYLVQQLNGRVSIDSNPDIGTTVEIILPVLPISN